MKCSLSSTEAYGSLKEIISEIKVVGLSEPVLEPDVALKVLLCSNFVYYCGLG